MPEQVAVPLEKCGVMVIVAVIGNVVALMAMNEAMLPVPLAAKPILGTVLVQLYVVVPPVLLVEKDTAVVFSPLHTT